MNNKKRITIFFLTIIIVIILIIITSILFSNVIPNNGGGSNTNTTGTPEITLYTTPTSTPLPSKERKDIVSISGKTINEKDFPLKTSDKITIELSQDTNTVVVKPCLSNAAKYFQRQQLGTTEQDVINALRDNMKPSIDAALKNADIDAQKNTIQYGDDQSC